MFRHSLQLNAIKRTNYRPCFEIPTKLIIEKKCLNKFDSLTTFRGVGKCILGGISDFHNFFISKQIYLICQGEIGNFFLFVSPCIFLRRTTIAGSNFSTSFEHSEINFVNQFIVK
jgi:hypothetical protein